MFKVWTNNSAFSDALVQKLYNTGEEVEVIPVNYLNLVDYITQTGGGQLPIVYEDGVQIGGYDDYVIYEYLSKSALEAPTELSSDQATLVPDTPTEAAVEAPMPQETP